MFHGESGSTLRRINKISCSLLLKNNMKLCSTFTNKGNFTGTSVTAAASTSVCHVITMLAPRVHALPSSS